MDNKKDIKPNQENKSKPITRINDIDDPAERKKAFREAKAGKGIYKDNKQIKAITKNLIPLNERSPEEAREIRRKAAEATNRIKGEKKNAKQILDELLPLYANTTAITDNDTIPKDIKDYIIKHNINISQYHLIMLSQIYQAQTGSTKAAEFIRDTFGDKPINETHNINETISEADKQLINNLKDRLNIVDIPADQD